MDIGAVVDAVKQVYASLGSIHGLLTDIQHAVDPRWWVLNTFHLPLLSKLWDWLFDLITQTTDQSRGLPRDFTDAGAIQRYEPLTRAVADLGLVAVASWASYRLMWSQAVRSRYSVHLILPRLLLAAVLINFAIPLVQVAVDVNNTLCDVVLKAQGHAVFKDAIYALLKDPMKDLASGPGLTLLTTILILGGYLLLGLAYFVRYALLVVLTVTAPLAALAFVLPETHRYAREWGSLFVSTLFMQPMQLLILAIAFALDAEGSLPISHLYALAALWITFKVPGALHAASSMGTHATTSAKTHFDHLIKAAAKGVA